MKTSKTGVQMIKAFEGLGDGNKVTKGIYEPYKDCVGVWTIGYGSTYLLDGSKVSATTKPLTEPECEALLMKTLGTYEAPVNELKLTQNQYDACVSLCYNIGTGNFKSSTVYKKLLKGEKPTMENWLAWNKAKGKVLPGLTKRRTVEWSYFNK